MIAIDTNDVLRLNTFGDIGIDVFATFDKLHKRKAGKKPPVAVEHRL